MLLSQEWNHREPHTHWQYPLVNWKLQGHLNSTAHELSKTLWGSVIANSWVPQAFIITFQQIISVLPINLYLQLWLTTSLTLYALDGVQLFHSPKISSSQSNIFGASNLIYFLAFGNEASVQSNHSYPRTWNLSKVLTPSPIRKYPRNSFPQFVSQFGVAAT